MIDFKRKTVEDVVGINRSNFQFRPLATMDGKYIFYVTNEPGDLDIWRYDMKRQLTNTLGTVNTTDNEFSHAISLDGNYIAFLQGPLLGEHRLFRQSLKTGERYGYGGEIRLSPLKAIRNLSCNLDATHVAFAADNPHDTDIYLMDYKLGFEETPPYVNTVFNETFPWLSPDGNLLLFVSDRAGSPDIYFLDRRTGRLDNMPFANTQAIETFPFFIGGTQIMFLSNRSGRFRLYRYDWSTEVLDTLTWIDADGRLPLLP
jgi:Tol biopolymer transport system component